MERVEVLDVATPVHGPEKCEVEEDESVEVLEGATLAHGLAESKVKDDDHIESVRGHCGAQAGQQDERKMWTEDNLVLHLTVEHTEQEKFSHLKVKTKQLEPEIEVQVEAAARNKKGRILPQQTQVRFNEVVENIEDLQFPVDDVLIYFVNDEKFVKQQVVDNIL